MKREREAIRAIYHKDIVNFFKSIGLFDKLESGEILCSICGEKITVENFRTVTRKSNELLFCCDKDPCIQKFTSYLRGGKE
jgi:dimeric dUTPase (all-alpha-NTP-PPase superfamily)